MCPPRSVILSWSSFSVCGLPQAVEVAFQSIYVIGPEAAERSEPGIQLLKWFGFQPVDATLRVDGEFYETGLSQHAEVL